MISMPDSIYVSDLPPGYSAYLGYLDGQWSTLASLEKRFPGAHLLGLTVTGQSIAADGIDIEPGNPDAVSGVKWVVRKLASDGAARPVIYASVIGRPGYGMGDVLPQLAALRIDRSSVRLLSAHYGAGQHICGPHTCGEIGTDMDGTQWSDDIKTASLAVIDMSVLRDDFFGPVPTRTEVWVQQLGIVRQGDTGEAVKTVQALCNARAPHPVLSIDGIFGWRTKGAVELRQAEAHITQDGVVGPQTWPVLLGIA